MQHVKCACLNITHCKYTIKDKTEQHINRCLVNELDTHSRNQVNLKYEIIRNKCLINSEKHIINSHEQRMHYVWIKSIHAIVSNKKAHINKINRKIWKSIANCQHQKNQHLFFKHTIMKKKTYVKKYILKQLRRQHVQLQQHNRVSKMVHMKITRFENNCGCEHLMCSAIGGISNNTNNSYGCLLKPMRYMNLESKWVAPAPQ